MVFTTEGFLEVAIIKSWHEQDFIYIYIYIYIIYNILYTYIIYSNNKNVINANSFDDPFLASKKDSQGVISRI